MAVANLTQWLIMCSTYLDDPERSLFQVEYDDHGGAMPAINNIPMADEDSDMDDSDDE